MFILGLAFVAVFLCGCDAALPKVGHCEFMQYYCEALTCNTDLFKKITKNPDTNCSVVYRNMSTCIGKTIEICTDGLFSKKETTALISQTFDESTLCSYGSLDIPVQKLGLGVFCSEGFDNHSLQCEKPFRDKFTANRSDEFLCSEYAQGKKCLKNLFTSNCALPALLQETINLSLNDYNPYCANNRDPEATGSALCEGHESPTRTPTSKGPKASAPRMILTAAPIILLFFFLLSMS